MPTKTYVPSRAVKEVQAKQGEQLWYAVDRKAPKDLAQAVKRAATNREIANIPTRWRSFVYFREMTGRPALSAFAYGMSKRPPSFINYYSSFNFSGAKAGFAASMADVYTNRLLPHMTYVSFIPSNGDYSERVESQTIEEFVEGGFDQLEYWRHRTIGGLEAFWYGTMCMWFDEDDNGNPMLESVNPDEILLSNNDDPNPYDLIRRQWVKKTELIEKYKDNPDAVEAIANATTAYPAFYFGTGTLDCSDIVPMLKAYTRPLGSTPGRRVECVGDYVLVDKEWDYPIPCEFWQFNQLPGSCFGQGIAELLLQISQWIDGLLQIGQEAEQRGGAGKWLYDENSNVNLDALGDQVAAAVPFLGKEPKYITPEAVGQWWIQHIELLKNLGRERVHVSEQAIKGEAPKAFTSGVALEKYAEIDDQTFLEKISRLEEFDRRCAYQLLMLGKRTNCTFIRKGKTRKPIKWSEIKFNDYHKINNLQAYNVGRLSQTVAGRVQQLKEMYAEKTIDKKLYIKYQQTPDIPGMFSDLNADVDDVQDQLDALVKSKDYIPPSPYMDFAYAKQAAETRFSREEALGSPQEVLDRLSIWISTVNSMISQNTTPDQPAAANGVVPPPPGAGQPPIPGPAPGGFGIQPPPEAAAVAPLQPLGPQGIPALFQPQQ